MLTIAAQLIRIAVTPLTVATTAALVLPSPGVLAGPTLSVQNCDDAGPGSLRDIVENVAQPGDIVDLSALPTICGPDSIITLSAEIGIKQDDLTLRGPKPGHGSVTLTGNHSSRVLHHTGMGTLRVNQLIVANGFYTSPNPNPSGGCIASSGNVELHHSTVTECVAQTTYNAVRGGGIFSEGTVTLVESSVSGNQALATMTHGWGLGGGVYAAMLNSTNSTLSGNKAQSGDLCGQGGGAFIKGETSIVSSTIDNNEARCGSAIEVWWASIVDIRESTISMNVGGWIGAVRINFADSARISNSTIVLNHSDGVGDLGLGVYFRSGTLTVQSSIIANNTTDVTNTAADLYVQSPSVLLGSDDLINAANVPLQGIATVQADPMIGPLAFNGGPTRTHALLRGSPAIGAGDNLAGFAFDQRGIGYPRMTGTHTDIGAFESDSIFADDFES
jgi:hypothetical protein